MLNAVIQLALKFRLVVVCLAVAVIVLGSIVANSLPIDVLPNLTRPRVVLITEAVGFAPEEVEKRVTFPLETAINGAPDVIAVRSSSGVGLSVIYCEFDWGTDVYTARQIVQERLRLVEDQLPPGIRPTLGPVSSLLGQIMLLGMWSETGATDDLQLRTTADWVVAKQLKSINGVSQVITMGGGRKQVQVLVDQHKMHQYEVALPEVELALRQSNLNVSGGFSEQNAQRLLLLGIGRFDSIQDVEKTVVAQRAGRSVLVKDIAEVCEAAQQKQGDASVNGRSAVVLTIQKQPHADTRKVTALVNKKLEELRESLPADVQIEATYQQRRFIDHSIANVAEALRDGSILVVVVLFLFLLNFRTTVITLVAIPLSILVTALVFRYFNLSINVMTLGGLAVALGELVDDAIVDVENIFRRLRQNRQREKPRAALAVIFEASVEVRNAIIISTVLVIVVFMPLFALGGLKGRLFAPFGVAYIVSILASTIVSLTVTPVLSYYLLPKAKATSSERDGFMVQMLKWIATPIVRFSMRPAGLIFGISIVVVGFLFCCSLAVRMGMDFLPKFDEGAMQVNLFAPPGTSLGVSRELSQIADLNLSALVKSEDDPEAPLLWFTCKTGRAENDEHIMDVNVSEYVLELNPDCTLSRQEIDAKVKDAVKDIPGVTFEAQQPIDHLISHMLSGVMAQIAIKLFGDDLDTLRRKAAEIESEIADVEGIDAPMVEQQTIVPQLRVQVDSDRLARYGVTSSFVQDYVETAMNGRVVSQVVEESSTFDLLLRLAESYRTDLTNLGRTPMHLPSGNRLPLSALARVYESGGPNRIERDNGQRRIVVRVNTEGRDLASVVEDISEGIDSVELPEGYSVELGGQFQEQQQATFRILSLSVVALVVVFVVLYSTYSSISIVLQILFSLPAAFIGGLLALFFTGQNLSVAALVGFISLGGIAARNGLLLVSNYLDRIPDEGFSENTILTGSLERLAPVLMTALTTGIALVPLVVGGQQPGKEILLPVATVVLGGLLTSTLVEFLIRPGLFFHFAPRDTLRSQSAIE